MGDEPGKKAGTKAGLHDGFTALTIGAFGRPAGVDAGEASKDDDKGKADAKRPAAPATAPDLEMPSRPVAPMPSAPVTLPAEPSAHTSSRDALEPTTIAKTPDHNFGHRDRLRRRLREGGAAAVAEYELLEMVLFGAIARRDTKPLAKTLLEEFGSLAAVINAPEARLRQVRGVGDAVVSELRLMGAVSRAVLREAVESRPVLSSWEAVIDYARAHIAFSNVEHFHVLFLDKKNRLIRDEIQQTGTVDHTPVYPREVVRRAIELDATALVLVHNHPSGDTTPSRADVEMTKTVIDVARPLGIAVHDHVIVGRSGHASMKGLRLI